MPEKLYLAEVKDLVENLKRSMIRAECKDCECFQGVLVQIEIVSHDNVSEITDPLKVPAEQMHSCLGCDPCPPAEVLGDISRPGKP